MKCKKEEKKKEVSTDRSNLPTSGHSSTVSKHLKYGVKDARSLENAIAVAVCYVISLVLLALVILWGGSAYADTRSISVDGYSVDQIVSAIYKIEGGSNTKYPYGIKSIPCKSPHECKRIAENTVVNNIQRWHASKTNKPYFEFLRDRYAPLDDHSLNRNWLPNLKSVLGGAK